MTFACSSMFFVWTFDNPAQSQSGCVENPFTAGTQWQSELRLLQLEHDASLAHLAQTKRHSPGMMFAITSMQLWFCCINGEHMIQFLIWSPCNFLKVSSVILNQLILRRSTVTRCAKAQATLLPAALFLPVISGIKVLDFILRDEYNDAYVFYCSVLYIYIKRESVELY